MIIYKDSMGQVLITAGALPETEIIQKIINGESALFELLLRRYNPVLYKIARGFGFNHQDAEDLLQDTQFAAYCNLSQFQFRAAYKTWLSTIMTHKCFYKLNHGYTKYEKSNSIVNESTEMVFNAYQVENGETYLIKKEFASLLENSLSQLPDAYRIVFILREVQAFSVQETAALLNISIINVKVRLNRAKAMLQKKLSHFYNREDLYEFHGIYCNAIVKKVLERIGITNHKTQGSIG